MAHFLLHFILSLLITLSLTFPAIGTTPTFGGPERPRPFKLGTQKLSHFQFYWHDIMSGTNPTSISMVNQPSTNNHTTPFGFGIINMIDNPLTEKPEIGSKMVGRAQGLYGLASQEELGLVMAMNLVFTTGRFNGSTLTVMGSNPMFEKVREMPVVGGSGLFRFARGYVETTTYNMSTKTGDAIVKYNVYVLHY